MRIASADLIVFVLDGKDGLVSGDEEIAATIRQSGRPVVVAVNKTDDRKAQARLVEFYALGFDPVIAIASEHGTGVGDLLDAVTSRLAVGKSARHRPSRKRRRSRSSAAPTSASRRWSTGCSRKSAWW